MVNEKVLKSDAEWKKILTPEQFRVLRRKGIERAGSHDFHLKKKGKFYCVACDNLLFNSEDKFDSGTGWPSFTKPALKTSVEYREDNGFFSRRTEVVCSRCGGHLGHVFDDGPKPTGKRFCMNGVALDFKEGKK